MPVTFDPEKHCGGLSSGRSRKAAGESCRNLKGFRTNHFGVGRCLYHLGSSPTAKKSAARPMAERAVAKLGKPLGSGDPFVLLKQAVQHAQGQLAAAAAVLVESAEYVEANKADAPKRPLVEDVVIAADIYQEAIRTAGRTGKLAVDAKVADRQQAIDLQMYGILRPFIAELLDRVVPKERRPEIEVWAQGRFVELAHELEAGQRIH